MSSRTSISDNVDLHIVAMLLLFVPAGWAIARVIPWIWAVALVLVVPQGTLLVHVAQQRGGSRAWLGYLLVNETLVLLGAVLVASMTKR